MSKLIGAGILLAITLFMLLGFMGSEEPLGSPATLVALLLTVVLPGAGAGLLLRSYFGERDRRSGRKAELRQQTLESEILRFAGEHGGRLTAVEVATQLGLTPEAAKEALDGLAVRSQADIEVTEQGVLVYSFYDVRNLGGKSTAKGILDA